MDQCRYNGWKNYATWRVNLEIVSDYVDSVSQDVEGGYLDPWVDVNDLSTHLEQYVTDILETSQGEEIVLGYAMAFVSDCDWCEMAEAAFNDHPHLIAEEAEEVECDWCENTSVNPGGEFFEAISHITGSVAHICQDCASGQTFGQNEDWEIVVAHTYCQ